MKYSGNLLKKITLLYTLIMVPFILFGFFLLQSSNHKLMAEIMNNLCMSTTNTAKQLDESLVQIYETNSMLTDQSIVLKLANISKQMSSYEQSSAINQLIEQLTSISIGNNFIQYTRIYFKELGKAFNSIDYPKGSFQEFTDEQYQTLLDLSVHSGAFHYFINPITAEKTLSIILLPQLKNPSFIVEFILSPTNIKKYLNNSSTYIDDYYYFNFHEFDSPVTNLPDEFRNTLTASGINFDTLNEQTQIHLNKHTYFIESQELDYANATLTRIISMDSLLQPLHTGTHLLILFSVTGCIAFILFYFGCIKLIHKPLKQLMNGFKGIENGNFSTQVSEEKTSEFLYLYHRFNTMSKNLNQLIERDYNQKILLQKAELKQLQSQINPHFLYNSFFLLQRMIKCELNEEATEISGYLAEYFRYITRNSMEEVTLKEEYTHTLNYAKIQAIRFEQRITIQCEDLPEQAAALPVPKLILQPILENAFVYGLDYKESDGKLWVHFEYEEDNLQIIIEDNGERLNDLQLKKLQEALEEAGETSNTKEMTGILNIRRRLSIFSQAKNSMLVMRSELGGLKVIIILAMEVNNHV